MQLFMAVPMTSAAAVADFGGRRYRRFIPFNFLLSLAAPHLHGVLVVTADKFIAGVVVTADNWSPVSTTPAINFPPVSLTPLNSFSPVSLTLVININSRISPRIFEKFKTAPMEYLRAWGTLIHEKKLRSKISCQTPFKLTICRRVSIVDV